MFRVMEAMHWDYWTYKNQPPHVLVNIFNYLDTQSQYIKQKENGNK